MSLIDILYDAKLSVYIQLDLFECDFLLLFNIFKF